MTPDSRPMARTILARGWRRRCPACGVGRVFPRRFRAAARCSHCSWRLERGPGHWLGGSELNMLVTFPVATACFLAVGLPLGFHAWTAFFGLGVAAAFSLWFLERSRSLFYAVDYLLDPEPEEGDLGDSDDDWLRDVLEGFDPAPDGAGSLMPGRRAGSPTPRRPRSAAPARR